MNTNGWTFPGVSFWQLLWSKEQEKKKLSLCCLMCVPLGLNRWRPFTVKWNYVSIVIKKKKTFKEVSVFTVIQNTVSIKMNTWLCKCKSCWINVTLTGGFCFLNQVVLNWSSFFPLYFTCKSISSSLSKNIIKQTSVPSIKRAIT